MLRHACRIRRHHQFLLPAQGLAAGVCVATGAKSDDTSGWFAACLRYRGDDARRFARLAAIAAQSTVPLAAGNDVRYHPTKPRALQDIVTFIREITAIDAAGR